MKNYILMFACLVLLVGCGRPTVQKVVEPASRTVESRSKLDFLASIAEFHGFELEMTEPELNEIITRNQLGVTVTPEGARKTYHVWNTDGENVFIGFRDGKCTGIQRMRPDSTLAKERNRISHKALHWNSSPLRSVTSSELNVRPRERNPYEEWTMHKVRLC